MDRPTLLEATLDDDLPRPLGRSETTATDRTPPERPPLLLRVDLAGRVDLPLLPLEDGPLRLIDDLATSRPPVDKGATFDDLLSPQLLPLVE